MLVQTEPGSCLRPSSPRRLCIPEWLVASGCPASLDGNGTQKLSVVVAPAGWGKTTLLAEWARRTRDRQPVAWLTLDETDDEPQRFWTYVVTALMTATRGVGDAALVALRVPGIDPIDVALPALLNDLSGIDAKQTLILDDYHLLTDARIHEGVEYLLSYLPPSLRLVIAGRLDPPLPLARMRARGELTEIRAADLRFSPAEATGLVSAVSQVYAGPDMVDPLVNRTEGWAVGLKLAALTIRGAPDPAARAAEVRGDDRHIIDFLTSEVLDRLPTDRRDFLVRTAVLDRLCGSLCDAVLDRAASSAVLEALERADLFVVPLDVHREWYRYHRLFRDVLRRELEADRSRGCSRPTAASRGLVFGGWPDRRSGPPVDRRWRSAAGRSGAAGG